jgi:peptidyl-prolyl cis-trans isomerase A (cyclophilin A)
MINSLRRAGIASVLILTSLAPVTSQATIVEIQTSLGSFEVNLYDNGTPATVTNFLDYVNNGAYTNAVVHRSVPGFVIQGGGFFYDASGTVVDIPANPAVANEPEYSNLRGKISMAKIGGNPNSATNQWFINLVDNSAALDPQNGGFSVFGEVVGNGMDVVDAIAALPIYAFAAPFGELPLQNYNDTDYANSVVPDDTQLLIISAVVVTDTTVDSAAGINPTPNTLIDAVNDPPVINGGGGGGGGAMSILLLLGLLLGASAARATRRS